MAKNTIETYTVNFHNSQGEIVATTPLEVGWQGNRYLTTRLALAAAQSFYGYLAYSADDDAEAGLHFACGANAVEFAQGILPDCDWRQGAVTMAYHDQQRRLRIAVFTMSVELGRALADDGERFWLTDADKGFAIAGGFK
jgi:hypothetical protein